MDNFSNFISHEHRLFKYQFAPYEFYYEDNKDKYKDEISLHLNKVKARKNYIKLDEQSKLIYLKKCEKAFDHFDVIYTFLF